MNFSLTICSDSTAHDDNKNKTPSFPFTTSTHKINLLSISNHKDLFDLLVTFFLLLILPQTLPYAVFYPIMTTILSYPSVFVNPSLFPRDDDLLSESSHSEAAQVFQTWQSEDDDDIMSNPGVVSDEEDDVFMQLEDDEGLLPSSLDDFFDTIPQNISSDDSIRMMLLSSQDMPANPPPGFVSNNGSHSSSTSDSFLSAENDRVRFQSTVSKLTESMRRSQETRRSLYARTPGLKDYKRLGSVERVLQSVEFSTHHIDTYCKAMTSTGPALQ